MERYLREIEISAFVLIAAGTVLAKFIVGIGDWLCGIGIFLWLITFLYKAFHWNEYERDNKRNIVILLITIFILLANITF